MEKMILNKTNFDISNILQSDTQQDFFKSKISQEKTPSFNFQEISNFAETGFISDIC
jgi:hypothetical protein